VEKLNRTIDAALADPQNRKRLADIGGVPMRMSPAEFGEFIAEETAKWAKVIKFAGAKID
jgi:tripartite-type tricarboxylate transporter receptor subunit TctC